MNFTRPMLGGAAVIGLAVVSACHHAVAPMAQPAPAPVAAPAPPPPPAALSAADRARMHADSVRAEVAAESSAAARRLDAWGMNGSDSSSLADKVHFDFNEWQLSQGDLDKLEAKRKVLAAHSSLVVQIAGNADERGPEEYNVALGLRRAEAAKRWLVEHGIDESRIRIISYGVERPLDNDHNEQAWAKNRRDDFLVLTGK